MDITINEDSLIPVYKQIVLAILNGVKSGELDRCSSIPPIRQLASDLQLTTATVSKAYQILQRSSVITTGGRRGTFIAENAVRNAKKHLSDELEWQVREFISTQRNYGVPLEQIEETFINTIKSFTEE